MKKYATILPAVCIFLGVAFGSAHAHCEIPCGIYDDATRMTLIYEHIKTIEKSMRKIKELEKENDNNQLVRWIINKENHAEMLQEVVTGYFMTQRIKLDAQNYDKKIKTLHSLLVFSMKAKQSIDLSYIEKLQRTADEFNKLYFNQ